MTERNYLTRNAKKIKSIITASQCDGFIEAKITLTDKFQFSKLSPAQYKDLFSKEVIVYKMTDMSMGKKPSDYFASSEKFLLIVFYKEKSTKIIIIHTSRMDKRMIGSWTYDELQVLPECWYSETKKYEV